MLIKTYFPKTTDNEPVIPKTINIIISCLKSLTLNIFISFLFIYSEPNSLIISCFKFIFASLVLIHSIDSGDLLSKWWAPLIGEDNQI